MAYRSCLIHSEPVRVLIIIIGNYWIELNYYYYWLNYYWIIGIIITDRNRTGIAAAAAILLGLPPFAICWICRRFAAAVFAIRFAAVICCRLPPLLLDCRLLHLPPFAGWLFIAIYYCYCWICCCCWIYCRFAGCYLLFYYLFIIAAIIAAIIIIAIYYCCCFAVLLPFIIIAIWAIELLLRMLGNCYCWIIIIAIYLLLLPFVPLFAFAVCRFALIAVLGFGFIWTAAAGFIAAGCCWYCYLLAGRWLLLLLLLFGLVLLGCCCYLAAILLFAIWYYLLAIIIIYLFEVLLSGCCWLLLLFCFAGCCCCRLPLLFFIAGLPFGLFLIIADQFFCSCYLFI